MNVPPLAAAASAAALLLALASLVPGPRRLSRWLFSFGMAALAAGCALSGLALAAPDPVEALYWVVPGFIAEALAASLWLGFSLTYSRAGLPPALARWRFPLALAALLPALLALLARDHLFDLLPLDLSLGPQLALLWPAKLVNALLLVCLIYTLMNLEQTFRSAVGTTRWRIKFVILGLSVIFGAHLYLSSQAALYSAYDLRWSGVRSSGLLVGALLIALAYLRAGVAEVSVYPSRALMRSSLTLFLAGGYLVVVGLLAKLVEFYGGAETFQAKALIILLGVAGLACLLLSDRLRQRLHSFVGRHFAAAQYDSNRIWSQFSLSLAKVRNKAGLAAASTRLISETFEVLSVSVWLRDENGEQFVREATSAAHPGPGAADQPAALAQTVGEGLATLTEPFNLERATAAWADELRQANPSTFPNGGERWCIPLTSGQTALGAIVLADRVSGAPYTAEQLQILSCLSGQITSTLLNLRLADELARTRELEAFRTMSAFFVHDLKNAASSLNLMLENLPVHFDDPEFRRDALRGIGNAARRIDTMISRLSSLRQRPSLQFQPADLNALITALLSELEPALQSRIQQDLQPVPLVFADTDQLRSVIQNLLLNARDAIGAAGHIAVSTSSTPGFVLLSVSDDGCGMSPEFLRDSLFRPFQSTKKNGLGIGMFQARQIVEAHGGTIVAKSEPAQGTTFTIRLPGRESE